MPNVWTRISLNTPAELKGKDPAEQKRIVRKTAAAHGAGLDELYFAPDRGYAYALLHLPRRDPDAVAKIVAELEGEETVELVTLEELLDSDY